MSKKSEKKDDKKIKFSVKQRIASFDKPLEYQKLTDKMGELNKKEAFRFLELKTFEGERHVRENHVQFLYDEYQAGRFLWHHVIIAHAILGQDEYRINGQHTCWMRVNVPDKQEPIEAPVRFISYRVTTSEDLRKLYAAFDRNAPRTVGHVSNVMLMDTRAGAQLHRPVISQCVSGFRIYFAEDWAKVNANPNELVAIIRENYSDVFNTVGHFLQTHRSDHNFVHRAAVAAAMMATFEKSVKASGDFWTPVCNGLGLELKSDPRYMLRNFLMTHGHQVKRPDKDMQHIGQEDLYRICINTWNRWRKGEQVEVIRTLDARVKPV